MKPIQGIHHITVMASDPQANIDFYTRVLGQRFIKRTVNFDDNGTYHLYYGDLVGSPGTDHDLLPLARRTPRPSRQWRSGSQRLQHPAFVHRLLAGSTASPRRERTATGASLWCRMSSVFKIRTACASNSSPTRVDQRHNSGPMVQSPKIMRYAPSMASQSGSIVPTERRRCWSTRWATRWSVKKRANAGLRIRFKGASDDHGMHVDLVERPGLGRGQMGAGTVHHVAFRVPDDAEQAEAQRNLAAAGIPVTEVKDRCYFRSIYFREPGGTIFEIATDVPGFAVDEPVEELGRSLMLPQLVGSAARIHRCTPAANRSGGVCPCLSRPHDPAVPGPHAGQPVFTSGLPLDQANGGAHSRPWPRR